MAEMTAGDVLAAIRRHHPRAALVPELCIGDDWAHFDWDPTTATTLPVTTRRVDALMFETRVRTAIEIKVSRADAKRESHRKVHPWRRVVHRYVYACPAGLLDFPPVGGCGLWWIHPNGRVEIKRKSRMCYTPEPLPQNVVQSIAFRAAGVAEVDPLEGIMGAI